MSPRRDRGGGMIDSQARTSPIVVAGVPAVSTGQIGRNCRISTGVSLLTMPIRPYTPQVPSPLDTHLRSFLDHLDGLQSGFAPAASVDIAAAATACNAATPFIDALFTSARTRGLIEPFLPPGARGRYRWRVSARGNDWRSEPAEAS